MSRCTPPRATVLLAGGLLACGAHLTPPSPFEGATTAPPLPAEPRGDGTIDCGAPRCSLDLERLLDDRTPADSPVASLEVRIAEGSVVQFVPDAPTAAFVVLEGSVLAVAAGQRVHLAPWEIVVAPGLDLQVRGSGEARGVLIAWNLEEPLTARLGAAPPSGVAAVHTLRVEPVVWGNGGFSARIGMESPVSVSVLTLAAGGVVAEHVHTEAWEHLVVLGGGGTLTTEGQVQEVSSGEMVFAPKGTKHAFVAGDQGFVALQVYAPGGPEQRFRALASP